MNILFLNSASRGWGGNEKWTMLASEALSKTHGVYLAYRDPLIGNRFSVNKFRLPFLAEIDIVTIIKLVQIIHNEHINVLIPTKRKDYVIAGIASRLCGIANILRLGIDRPLKNNLLHKLIYHFFADGIIVNAEKIKETLLQTPWINPDKIKIIYNGLDCDELEKSLHKQIHKPFGFLIVSAGALISRKGFDALIRAFSIFMTRYPDSNAGLIIAGDGPQREELETLASTLAISEKVRFEGFLENPYHLMTVADVFVSTSQSEGISNALLESMFLECVPVSTYSGGADEILHHEINGFLIQYGDEEKLAKILSKLYHNPALCQSIAHEAKRTVLKKFSTSLMQAEIIDFLREIRNKKKNT